MTLKGKLRLASATVLVMMALLALLAIFALDRVTASTHRVHAAFSRLDAIQDLRIGFGRILIAPNDYLIFGERAQVEQFAADVASLERKLAAAEKLLDDGRVHAATRSLEMLQSHAKAAFELPMPVGNPLGQQLLRQLDTLVQLTTDDLDRLLAETRAEANEAVAAAGELDHRVTLAVILIGGVVLIAVLGVLLFARHVAARLAAVHAAVSRLSEGDVSARVEVTQRDEIGEIGEAFNQMVVDLDRAQAKLLEAERLAAIGQMAVTVKHEMNNPIHGIMAATELVKSGDGASLPEPVTEALDMILEGCEQLRDVVARVTSVTESAAPVTKYVGDVDMIDIRGEQGGDPEQDG